MPVEVTSAVLKYTGDSVDYISRQLIQHGTVSTAIRLGVGDMQPLQVSSWKPLADGSLVVYLKRTPKPDSPV